TQPACRQPTDVHPAAAPLVQDCTVITLIVVLAVVIGGLGAAFRSVVRADSNEAPALGTNNPFPESVGVLGPGEEAPNYLPTPVISEAEQFRRDAHLHLAPQTPCPSPSPSPPHQLDGNPRGNGIRRPGRRPRPGKHATPTQH
ncbi:MAG: hypothetical protein M3R48_10200, partial [Candidatus Dormibacteraeota bacterium]|nr:hypothetical protein [Candidatus Dormibacteraeota bacterium]